MVSCRFVLIPGHVCVYTVTLSIVSATNIDTTSITTITSAVITIKLNNTNCNGQQVGVLVQRCVIVDCVCSPDFTYDNPMVFTHTVGTGSLIVYGLISRNTYCYQSTLTVSGVLVGREDSSFMTSTGHPPVLLNDGTARLLSFSGSITTYECVNSIEGFNGNRRQIAASFDINTGQYNVPQCSGRLCCFCFFPLKLMLVFSFSPDLCASGCCNFSWSDSYGNRNWPGSAFCVFLQKK